jgi:cell wall-associated NlpC family hydrolase
MIDSRRAFAAAAEALIDTPFRFHGRDATSGLDCVGLVVAALETIGAPRPSIARYALRQRGYAAQLNSAADAGFEDAQGDTQPGDLLLLRPGPAQLHLAVVAANGSLIHAHAGLGKVAMTPPPCPWPIARHWRLRQD